MELHFDLEYINNETVQKYVQKKLYDEASENEKDNYRSYGFVTFIEKFWNSEEFDISQEVENHIEQVLKCHLDKYIERNKIK